MMMQEAPIPPALTSIHPEVVKPAVVEVVPPVHCPIPEDTVEETREQILQELTSVDRLFITKRLHMKSALFLRGTRNRFFVRTPDQNLLYTVEEENSSWWVGYFCYGLRPLQLRVTNGEGIEVMRINRPYACTARVMPCQMQNIQFKYKEARIIADIIKGNARFTSASSSAQVFAPPGNLIGSIEQQWTYIRPIYLVKDAEGVDMLWIRGPYFTISFFRDIQFQISHLDGTPVGATNKRWQGLAHAMLPLSDRFGVAFDRELTVQQKAMLLAATLLLDYMYYDV